MAVTISLGTPKGGAGKTTNVVGLASVLSNEGFKVCVLDADPKQRTFNWSTLSNEGGIALPDNLSVLPVPENPDDILDIIDKEGNSNDFILIDVEGTENTSMMFSFAASDFIIIPCKDSMQDGADVISTVRVIKSQERVSNRKIPHAVLFNEIEAAYQTRDLKNLREQFSELGIDIFNTQMIKRVAHRAPHNYGGILHDLPSHVTGLDSTIENVSALAKELFEKLKENANG